MIDLPQRLTSWLKTQGAALLAPGTPPVARAAFQPGATYTGRVIESLSDGRSLVQVAGQPLDMALPRGSQVGDTLRLTYLYGAPRPTFSVEQQAIDATQPVRLSQSAQQLTALAQLARPATTRAPPPTVPTAAQVAQAGAGAQRPLLEAASPLANPPSMVAGGNLSAGTGIAALATATALTGDAPVGGALAGLATDGATSNLAALHTGTAGGQAVLPQRLHQTLRESGLFYEAHLQRWARGAFELAALHREPQAHIASDAPMATAAGLTNMPEEAARLAGRQLQMLDGAPFLWQGFAWPGQWLEWQVREQGGGGSGEDVATWATELRLTLPHLGGVSARLSLAGDRLVVGLGASDAATQEAMRAALPRLEQALKLVGLKPAGIGVGRVDAA